MSSPNNFKCKKLGRQVIITLSAGKVIRDHGVLVAKGPGKASCSGQSACMVPLGSPECPYSEMQNG